MFVVLLSQQQQLLQLLLSGFVSAAGVAVRPPLLLTPLTLVTAGVTAIFAHQDRCFYDTTEWHQITRSRGGGEALTEETGYD